MRDLLDDSFAWLMILLPLALVAICFGLPHALDVLGAVFQAMRDAATAVKG